MPNSDVNSGTCYSGILRRLLCSGSLPTHPSEQFTDSNNFKQINDQKPNKFLQYEKHDVNVVASTPGVVARLMGLDSLPTTPLPHKDRTLGSYFRSKSANSIDFFSHFDPVKTEHHHKKHRRARTAVSLVNDDFYSVLLPLEEVDESVEYLQEFLNVNGGRGQIGQQFKEKKVTSKKKIEIEVKRESSDGNSVSQKKKRRLNLKERRAVMKKKVDLEGYVRETCSRKPLAMQISNSERAYSSSNAHSEKVKERAICNRKSERKIKNEESSYYKRMVDEIFRVTEEDCRQNWNYREVKFEDSEEICQDFGEEILQVLLEQFVDELVLCLFMG